MLVVGACGVVRVHMSVSISEALRAKIVSVVKVDRSDVELFLPLTTVYVMTVTVHSDLFRNSSRC